MTYEEALKKWEKLPLEQESKIGKCRAFIVPDKKTDHSNYLKAFKSIKELDNEDAKNYSSNGQYRLQWLGENKELPNHLFFEDIK